MKKWIPMLLMAMLLLAGCTTGIGKQDNVVDTKNKSGSGTSKSIIPGYQVSTDYYRTVLPYKASKSRGVTVSSLNFSNTYNIQEFETGLTRVAKQNFSTDDYFFQEGQYIDSSIVKSWLNRYYDSKELKNQKLKASENLGLNPQDTSKPMYLSQILEQDYLVKDDKNSLKLGGVVIGLALNSKYYYQKVKYGPVYHKDIGDTELTAQGKAIAAKMIKRVRNIKGLTNVPVSIALFKQSGKDDVIPGNFVNYAVASKGSSSLGSWKKVDEENVLFAANTTNKEHQEDVTSFNNFEQDIQKYFPNQSVIGNGLYENGILTKLDIELPIQFSGEQQLVGFTQYVSSLLTGQFSTSTEIEVSITSLNQPKALITRDVKEKEPSVHIYQ